jgi:hypothetical protein
MEHSKRTTLYLVALLAMYTLASTSDYHAARERECANRSTTAWDISWDQSTDTCKKERRDGTTTQNR